MTEPIDLAASQVETLQHIKQVAGFLAVCIRELTRRQSDHDASKLASPELEGFAGWTPKLRGTEYGTPEYHAMLAEMKPFLDHHYACNSHHPEYWPAGIRGMDLYDLMEMLCDWCAAATRHATGDIYRSIEINQKRFGYSDDLKQLLVNTVCKLNLLPRGGASE